MQAVKKGVWLPTPEELLAESVLIDEARLLKPLVGTSDDDTRRLWLEARKQSIGASDVSAIMGTANPKYQSRYKLWNQKMGLLPLDTDQSQIQLFGHLMEATAAKAFKIQFGKGEIVDPKGFGIRHNLFPWMTASVDRALVLDAGLAVQGQEFKDMVQTEPLWIPIEIKNVSEYKTDEWGFASIPEMYYDQVQAQLEVTAKPRALVLAIFGGNRMEVYTVWRDVIRGAQITTAAAEFWDSLATGDCPPPDDSEATEDALKQRFPSANGSEITMTAEMETLCAMMIQCDERAEEAMRQKMEHTNALRAAMGDATKAKSALYSINYSNREISVIDREAADKDEELVDLKGKIKAIESGYKVKRTTRALKVTENRKKV